MCAKIVKYVKYARNARYTMCATIISLICSYATMQNICYVKYSMQNMLCKIYHTIIILCNSYAIHVMQYTLMFNV